MIKSLKDYQTESDKLEANSKRRAIIPECLISFLVLTPAHNSLIIPGLKDRKFGFFFLTYCGRLFLTGNKTSQNSNHILSVCLVSKSEKMGWIELDLRSY